MLLLALTGCLEEGIDGCPDNIRLTFLHGDSSERFDREIGNDVQLFLYQDDHLYSATRIPYEQIKGGKEFIMKKEVTGDMDIVAWAVPTGEENVEELPGLEKSATRSGQNIIMDIENGYHKSLGHLYLGTVEYKDTDITKESVFNVSMINSICQFTATMNPDESVKADNGIWTLQVTGIKSEMDLDLHPQGEDATVLAEMFLDSQTEILKTNMHGLLPSADDQYIAVNGYLDGELAFTVKTQHQAKPGEVIHLQVIRKSVVLSVNGWDIYDLVVDWM